MGWGSQPNFCISRRTLNFNDAKQIFEDRFNKKTGEANISDQRDSRSNYAIVKQDRCTYALRMYRTHIITWHESGRIDFRDYSSAITRSTISAFSPLRVWSDSQFKGREKARFGNWHADKNFPFGDITIEADGKIYGLQDKFRRVKPECKKERMALVKEFKRYAVPRILLGEFGGAFVERRTDGYCASVPAQRKGMLAVFSLLSKNADGAKILEEMEHTRSLEKQCFGRSRGKINYPTPELAAMSAINCIIRETMADSYRSPWHEDYVVEYPPVVVADL